MNIESLDISKGEWRIVRPLRDYPKHGLLGKKIFKWKYKFITHILHANEPPENSQTHINATSKRQYKIIAIEKGRQFKKIQSWWITHVKQ